MSLLKTVQYKLRTLTSVLSAEVNPNVMADLSVEFCKQMLHINEGDAASAQGSRCGFHFQPDPAIDLMEEVRDYQKILNRRQIKSLSARLVDEHLRKDD